MPQGNSESSNDFVSFRFFCQIIDIYFDDLQTGMPFALSSLESLQFVRFSVLVCTRSSRNFESTAACSSIQTKMSVHPSMSCTVTFAQSFASKFSEPAFRLLLIFHHFRFAAYQMKILFGNVEVLARLRTSVTPPFEADELYSAVFLFWLVLKRAICRFCLAPTFS